MIISGVPNGKLQGSESVEPVEDSTVNAISRSRCLSIDNDNISPGTHHGINQEEYPSILDEPTSIVSNEGIIESTYDPTLSEILATHENVE